VQGRFLERDWKIRQAASIGSKTSRSGTLEVISFYFSDRSVLYGPNLVMT